MNVKNFKLRLSDIIATFRVTNVESDLKLEMETRFVWIIDRSHRKDIDFEAKSEVQNQHLFGDQPKSCIFVRVIKSCILKSFNIFDRF